MSIFVLINVNDVALSVFYIKKYRKLLTNYLLVILLNLYLVLIVFSDPPKDKDAVMKVKRKIVSQLFKKNYYNFIGKLEFQYQISPEKYNNGLVKATTCPIVAAPFL